MEEAEGKLRAVLDDIKEQNEQCVATAKEELSHLMETEVGKARSDLEATMQKERETHSEFIEANVAEKTTKIKESINVAVAHGKEVRGHSC